MNSNSVTMIGSVVVQLVAVIILGAIALIHDGDSLSLILPVLSAIAGGSLVSTTHLVIANAATNNQIRTAQAGQTAPAK